MTKAENIKLEKLMEEAIRNAEVANREFKIAKNSRDELEKDLYNAKAQNHKGYAEGINQVLVTLNFKHEDMEKLSELL